MPSLSQIPNGVHYYKYEGEVEVADPVLPVQQTWDFSAIPLHIRQAIGFEDQYYVFAKALSAAITNIVTPPVTNYAVVDGKSTPASMTLTLNCTDATAQILLIFLTAHTLTR